MYSVISGLLHYLLHNFVFLPLLLLLLFILLRLLYNKCRKYKLVSPNKKPLYLYTQPDQVILPSNLTTDWVLHEFMQNRPLILNCNATTVGLPPGINTIQSLHFSRELYSQPGMERIADFDIATWNTTTYVRSEGCLCIYKFYMQKSQVLKQFQFASTSYRDQRGREWLKGM